jgi:hypothetical protein
MRPVPSGMQKPGRKAISLDIEMTEIRLETKHKKQRRLRRAAVSGSGSSQN